MSIKRKIVFLFTGCIIGFVLLNSTVSFAIGEETETGLQIKQQINNCKKLLGRDNNLARMYAIEALKQSKESNSNHFIGESYFYLGLLAYYNDDYNTALNYYDSALIVYNPENDKKETAKVFFQSARSNAFLSNYDKAIDYMNKAIKLRKELSDRKGLAMCYGFLGIMYRVRNNPEKALEYFNRSHQYLDVESDSLQIAGLYCSFADIFQMKNKNDSAIKYYKMAFDVYLSAGNQRFIASTKHSLGNCLLKKEDYIGALDHLKGALNIYKELDEKYGSITTLLDISRVYSAWEKWHKAKQFSLDALIISSSINNDRILSEINLQLSGIYTSLNKYDSAFYYLQQYIKLYKNIFAADREKIVQEMENKFKISEKNREIITLQAKNRQIRDRYLMMILVAALLIIIVTSFLVNYTLRNKSLKQRNKLLHNEKILREKENKLKEQEYTILKNKLETKNKELASKSLELLRYNETLRTITDKLQSVEKYVGAEHKKDLFALIKEVETFSKDNMWKEFETAFKNVHTDFYENLIEQFPDLTPSEIKLAALLRLNFSTKEIAAVTFKSESGIKSIRHRLRKKMGLESDSNLITFLLKL